VSRWLYPFERRILWRRRLVAVGVVAAAFIVLLALDGCIYRGMRPESHEALVRLEGKDWYKAFRVVGTIWPWLFIGGALVAEGIWARRQVHARVGEMGLQIAGLFVLASAVASGFAAEILQTLTGRLRPNKTVPEGRHVFRGLIERFQNSDNLGFPSSHAAVAFGAAFMVWFFWPRAGVIALIAALLCGLTRLWAGAHFATDVFGAALVGYALARLLRPGSWARMEQRLLL
jgi:membrane-associated phospholipid phosphatase